MSEVQTQPGDARYRIAVDTGGTFTDVVVGSNTGDMAVGKALTTYDRVFTGFEASVRRAAESVGWSGDDVLRHADVIVYGTTRKNCIMRLKRALEEFVVEGMKTTVPLHQRIIADEAFLSGDYTIKWLERWLDENPAA